MSGLILLRHGNSMWNQKNIFTGWVDILLSKKGVEEAKKAGQILSKIKFDSIFTSALARAQMTLQLVMLESEDKRTPYFNHDDDIKYNMGVDRDEMLPIYATEALNERCYGDLQGREKEQYKSEVGEELFCQYRRGYAKCPPKGESLEHTIERAIPYFEKNILPNIEGSKTVLIVAHGNSLRGIVKEVLGMSNDEIISYEIATGKPLLFKYNKGIFSQGVL